MPEEHVIPLNSAIAIANSAHYGQVDKAGAPYILHPIRVMLRMRTREEQIVALLHDTIEDTRHAEIPAARWNLDKLWKFFPSETLRDAIDAITRRDDEPYEDYIRRVAANELARAVKIEDLADNRDPARALPSTPENERRLDRYLWAQAYLSSARMRKAFP